jgi:hypothetical protein
VKPKTKETFHANEFRSPLFKLDALFFLFHIVFFLRYTCGYASVIDGNMTISSFRVSKQTNAKISNFFFFQNITTAQQAREQGRCCLSCSSILSHGCLHHISFR